MTRHTFIIAEVGSTHDGSFGNALQMIDVAAEAGADAVKFQTHFAEAESLPGAPSPGSMGCQSDDECTEGTNGRCLPNRFQNECSYDDCFADSDCGGGACLCRGARGGVGSYGANQCVGGNCGTDADCGPGGYCSPSLGDCGDYGGVVGYYCRTCEDECLDDSDCTEETSVFGGGYCAYNPAVGHWACSYSQCAG